MLEWLKRKIALRAASIYFETRYHNDFILRLFTVDNIRINNIFDHVLALALRKGFRIKRPRIRQIRSGLIRIKTLRSGVKVNTLATATNPRKGPNIIMIFPQALRDCSGDPISDLALAVILAHELGHVVDFQTRRNGHPLFENIRHVDDELFADAFASFILSKAVVISEKERLSAPLDEAGLSKLDLSF